MGVSPYSLGHGYHMAFSPIVDPLCNMVGANKVVIRSLKAGWSVPECLYKVYYARPIISLEPGDIS